MYLLHIFGH